MSLTIDRPFQITTTTHGRKVVASRRPPAHKLQMPVPQPVGRIPRITRLMALAIKLDGYVRDGVVTDYAGLARLGHVSRARITQIMDLNLLSPDIQESILDLPRTVSGRDPIREQHVRRLVTAADWRWQRRLWQGVVALLPTPHGVPSLTIRDPKTR